MTEPGLFDGLYPESTQKIQFLETGSIPKFEKNSYTAGIDEVAVSPIAGPMVSCLVAMPKRHNIPELPVDSKKLKEDEIAVLAAKIEKVALYVSYAWIDSNQLSIKGTHQKRISLNRRNAVEFRKISDVTIILDGAEELDNVKKVKSVPQAEGQFVAVSAASILAKHRTNVIMNAFHELYPFYEFDINKGYETNTHINAILTYGLSPVHRSGIKLPANPLRVNNRKKNAVRTSKNALKEEIDLHSQNELNETTWEFIISELNKVLPLEKMLLGNFGYDFFSNVRTQPFHKFTPKMKTCLLKIYFETLRKTQAEPFKVMESDKFIWLFDQQAVFHFEINQKTQWIIQNYSSLETAMKTEEKILVKLLVQKKNGKLPIGSNEMKKFRNLFLRLSLL